jgi:RHS repeat-associated protein
MEFLQSIARYSLVFICFIATHAISAPVDPWQQLLEDYADGKNIDGLLEQLQPSNVDTMVAQPDSTARQLSRQLAFFVRQINQIIKPQSDDLFALASLSDVSPQQLLALKADYELLQAQHQLYVASLTDIKNVLRSTGREAFLTKLEAAQARYDNLTNPLYTALDTVFSALEQPPAQDDWFDELWGNIESTYNLYQLLEAIDALNNQPGINNNILRAQSPYAEAQITSLALDDRPAIIASFASSTLFAPDPQDRQPSLLVTYSDAIRLKAEQLNHDPIEIFHFVKNHITTEWYYGAMKGADTTLSEGAGNDADQSALLIALLRASGVAAHFVEGVVELSIAKLQTQLGIENPQFIVTTLKAAGYPAQAQIRGGRIDAVQVNYVWVSAYVPYTNYRGAVVDSTGQQWLALFPMLKNISIENQGALLQQASVDSDALQQTYFTERQQRDVVTSVTDAISVYLNTNGLGAYIANVPLREIITEHAGYLPNSLPIPVIKVTSESASLPSTKLHQVRFVSYTTTHKNQSNLDVTVALADLANQRVTLSYLPGSIEEQQLVQQFGGLANTPAYLVSLTPQIKVNGFLKAVGTASIPMGNWHNLTIELLSPNGVKMLDKKLLAGAYHGIGITAQGFTQSVTDTAQSVGDTEFLAARVLSQIARRYSQAWYQAEQTLAALSGLAVVRPWPAVVFASNELQTDELFGQVQSLDWKGVNLDALYRSAWVVPMVEQAYGEKAWRMLAGLQGSYLEHQVFEQLFTIESISADKGLALASAANIAVHTVDADNIDVILPQLTHETAIIDDIRYWVGQGFNVTVPETQLTYLHWTGSVWVAQHPLTGESGYFIARGLAGGSSASDNWPASPGNALKGPYDNAPNLNPYAGRYVQIINAGNYQFVAVDTETSERLKARILDANFNPVIGASVTFEIKEGGGSVVSAPNTPGAPAQTITTDSAGFASVFYKAGINTAINQRYLMREATDQYHTRVAQAYIDVSVAVSSSGQTLSAKHPMLMWTEPGGAGELELSVDHIYAARGLTATPLKAFSPDEFGNPVANVNVTAVVGEARPARGGGVVPHESRLFGGGMEECIDLLPPTIDSNCGVTNTLTIKSNALGSAWIYPIMDDVEAAEIDISIQEQDVLRTVAYNIIEREASWWFPARPVPAAKVGGEYTGAAKLVQHDWVPGDSVDINNGGLPISIDKQGNDTYLFKSIGVPSTPGRHTVKATLTYYEPGGSDRVVELEEHVYAVEINVAPLTAIALNLEDSTEDYVNMDFDVAPLDYNATLAQVVILEDTIETYFLDASLRANQPTDAIGYTAVLPSGFTFDPERNYTATAIINRNTDAEVHSDPADISFFRPILGQLIGTVNVPEGHAGKWQSAASIAHTGSHVMAYREIDVANDFICNSHSALDVEVNQDAHIKVELMRGGIADIVIDQDYDKGTHELPLPLSSVSPGLYIYKLTGTSLDDGHQTVKFGTYAVRNSVRNSRPVGHAHYEDVDLFDGHLSFSNQDFMIEGLGPDLQFVHSYTSSNDEPSMMGLGWSHNYDSYVTNSGCGSFSVIGGDGGGVRFFADSTAPGGYRPGKGYHGTLIPAADASAFDFYSKDGTRYHYRKFGFGLGKWHLEYIQDRNGNTTSLGYNPVNWQAEVSVVEDAIGRKLTFEYEAIESGLGANTLVRGGANKLLKNVTYNDIRTGDFFTVTFDHDDFGRLTTVSGPIRNETYTYRIPDSSAQAGDEGSVELTENDYLLRSALSSSTRPEGNFSYTWGVMKVQPPGGGNTADVAALETMSGRWGGQVEFDYPTPRAPLASEYTTVVSEPRVAASVDITYTLNHSGALRFIDGPAGVNETQWYPQDTVMQYRIDENGVRTDYTYDKFGNVLTETVDGFEPITSTYHADFINYRYNKTLLKTRTDKNKNKTGYKYDNKGNLESVSYEAVQAVDDRGELKSITASESYWYDTKGFRLGHKDRKGYVTNFTPDKQGYTKTIRDPLGNVTRLLWDSYGHKEQETDQEGNTFTFDHNLQGFMTRYSNQFGSKTMTYNFFGSKTSEKDADNREWHWQYNINNQLEREINPNNDYRELNYDIAGNLAWETDFRHNRTDYGYNDAKFQTSVTYPATDLYDSVNQTLSTDQRASLRRTFYPSGHIKSEEIVGSQQKTQYEYNNLYRKTKVTAAAGTADEQITLMRYDQDDLDEQEDALGNITRYQFDEWHQKRSAEQIGLDGLTRILSWDYDANGNLAISTDARGNKEVREYDELNRLNVVQDREGGKRFLYYYKNGLLESETDALQHVTRYTYDRANRLETVTDPKHNETTYTYYNSGLKHTESLANGNTLTHVYDENARLKNTTDLIGLVASLTFDADANLETQTDGEGYVSRTVYDTRGRVTETHKPYRDLGEGYTEQILKTGYSLTGNVAYQEDAKGYTQWFNFDPLNRLTLETDAANNNTQHSYDAVGNKLTTTDARNNLTTWKYDSLYRVTERVDPQVADPNDEAGADQKIQFNRYDLNSNLLETTDKRGFVTTQQYDKENRLLTTRRSGVRILKQAYDQQGNLILSTDANSNTTAYLYDERNQLSRESRLLAAITDFDYDEMGNKISERDPEGRYTYWEYDERNRLIDTWNNLDEHTLYTYTLNDQQQSQQRPKNNLWQYSYDSANRLASVTAPAGETRYRYDDNNNLVEQIDALDKTTRFDYDVRNLRLYIEYADSRRFTFDEYDENANLQLATDLNGTVIDYDYDALNRETLRTFVNSTSVTDDILSVETQYDLNNNVILQREQFAHSGVRDTSMRYDDFDRLQSKTDAFGKTLRYAYDLNGNRTATTDPDGLVTRYVPDVLNRIAQVVNTQGTTTYTYYRDSRIKSVEYPNDTESLYQYEAAGRVESINNTQNAALLSRFDYTYDANGNRDTQTEQNGGAAEVTSYLYDDLDRLEQVTYPDKVVTYTYDDAYNRQTEVEVETGGGTTVKNWDYHYNDRHQLTSITDLLDSAQNIQYQYDFNGNQTQKTQAGDVSDFVYDARDNLRQVLVGGSSVGQFLYDAEGLRTEKIGDRGTERYSYDDQSVILQYDNALQTQAKYDYGPNRLLSLSHPSEGTQFYLTDALNSVVNLANADGSVQARYQYDAWGNKRGQVGESWNRFAFTGYEEDTETGLLYAKARFYDAETGRFLGQDAWEGEVLTPPSLHKYLYAYQNPTVYVDPTGNTTEAVVAKHLLKRAALIPVVTGQEMMESQAAREDLFKRAVDGADKIVYTGPSQKDISQAVKQSLLDAAGKLLIFSPSLTRAIQTFVNVEDESSPVSIGLPAHTPGNSSTALPAESGYDSSTTTDQVDRDLGESILGNPVADLSAFPDKTVTPDHSNLIDKRPLLSENFGAEGEIVRRFMSKKDQKRAIKEGIKFDPNATHPGIPTATTNIDPVNPDKIKEILGAQNADTFIDIDISGKSVVRRNTKSGKKEIVVQENINAKDIRQKGKTAKNKRSNGF